MTTHNKDAASGVPGIASPDAAHSTTLTKPGRRGLLQGLGMAGAALTAGLLPRGARAQSVVRTTKASPGDIAILRFVAWAELVDSLSRGRVIRG